MIDAPTTISHDLARVVRDALIIAAWETREGM